MLSSPPSKEEFKTLTKKKVTDHWQTKFRQEANTKPSLKYFKPQFMSLQKPHPLLTSCNSNPWEINKALVQSRMLSGRCNTDWLTRHWSSENKDGFCVLCPGDALPGTLEHQLVTCKALESKRSEIYAHWDKQTENNCFHQKIIRDKRYSSITEFTQFLLDPSVDPDVISSVQCKLISIDEIFKLTRTFVYGLHRRRLKLIGRFNIFSN